MFITKQDVKDGFRSNKTRRRKLLFTYYQEWFLSPLTADRLAQKISTDLGISVDANLIYHTRQTCKTELTKTSEPVFTLQPKAHPSSLTEAKKELFEMPTIPDVKPVSDRLISYQMPTK